MLINDSESRFLMLEAEHVGLTVIDIASMLHKVLSKYENQIQSLCFKISFSSLGETSPKGGHGDKRDLG